MSALKSAAFRSERRNGCRRTCCNDLDWPAGVSARSLNASFTELGGDSLRAVELVLKIAKGTGVVLALTWPLERGCYVGKIA